MSESENKLIPDIKEVPPDQVEEVVKLLEEMGMTNLRGVPNYIFEIRFAITKNRQIEVNIEWDFDKKVYREAAILLDAITNGTLNKQILMTLTYLAGGEGDKIEIANKLLRRWTKLQEDGEEQPYIDSFQPLMPEQR